MVNIKYIFNIVLVIIFFTSVPNNLFAQSVALDNSEEYLRNALDYTTWAGKYDNVRNGINLSTEKLLSLSNVTEVKPNNLFFLSQDSDGNYFVKYRSQWQKTETDFMEITISFLKSCIDAHEYLMYRFISTTLPIENIINHMDTTPFVGHVSYKNGCYFIRNNIVVKIHAEGEMRLLKEEVAKEIDTLLLAQHTENTYNENIKPAIVKVDNQYAIIEP